MQKAKTFGITMAAVWFFGGPAYEPTTAVLRNASQAIQQFLLTIVNSV